MTTLDLTNLSSSNQFTITLTSIPPAPAAAGQPYSWRIANASGGITYPGAGFDAMLFNIDRTMDGDVGHDYWITGDANSLYINFVPEPGSGAVLVSAVTIGMIRRRRRIVAT
jgi:hypothetical protein